MPNHFLIFARSVADHAGSGMTTSYTYALLHHGWKLPPGWRQLLVGAYILMKNGGGKRMAVPQRADTCFRCVWGDIHASPFLFPPDPMFMPGNDRQWGCC